MRVIATLAAMLSSGISGSAFADPATPEDPNAYGAVVQFGAQEDHDIYPGPGNVIGDVRSSIARNSEDRGVAPFVEFVRNAVGSTPTPPGKED